MLKAIRKRLKLILWTLIITFVLWGVGTALSTRQAGSLYAGTLYGRPVTLQDHRAAWEATRHRAVLAYGERALTLFPPEELERQAWDWLTLSKAARRARIRVSDREVIEHLAQWPLFQRDGRFDPRTYQVVIRYSLGTTPRAFEEEIRGQLAIRKLLDRAASNLTVTEEELKEAYTQEAEAVRFAYLLVTPERFKTDVPVEEAELAAYAQAHPDEFESEPKVEIRTLAIPWDRMKDQVRVPEADILEEHLRQAPPQEHGTPPTAARQEELRQKLLQARARDRAADLAWELRDGWKRTPDLESLGRPHGLAPATAGPFARGETVPNLPSVVTQAAFDLGVGEISRVLETPEVFYLVTLVRKIPASPLPFEEAKLKIRERLVETKTRALAREMAQNLFATVQELLLAEAADPLGPAAEAVSLTITHTEFVTRATALGDHGTAGSLLGPAFALKDGQVGGPWETSRGFVIAQALERKPMDPEGWAQAKDRLREQLLQRKRTTTLEAWLTQLRQQAKPTPAKTLQITGDR